MINKRVLVACEESQAVTKQLRELGIKAFSCDLLPTSGDNIGWHLQKDVIPLLKDYWDMIIAFPPCTHLASSGARHFKKKRESGVQQEGIDFFMEFTKANSPRIAIENPIGIMSTHYRKPDQIVQPWWFGDSITKSTCLWLKGLPLLEKTNIVSKGEIITFSSGKRMHKWHYEQSLLPPKERSKARSKTFPGIALAMATQWGSLLLDK